MKKIIVLFIVLIAGFGIAGCNEKTSTTEEGTTTESVLMKKAKKDFFNRYGVELSTNNCYGEFNGALAFFLYGIPDPGSNTMISYHVITTYDLLGYKFTYTSSYLILVWKDGEFYTIPDDYIFTNHILTESDVIAMHEYHEANIYEDIHGYGDQDVFDPEK